MNLLDKTVADLMEKFGAGNHKPGSGSAAAFQGMVSAKLISTVITLTAEEKRRVTYGHHINDLLFFQDEINNRIYPALENLFQTDSEQFDITIKSRSARDNEHDEILKNQLRLQALKDLKISISTPIEIAKLCKEVAEMASFVFDNGFRGARGDSQVGLSGAVSAIGGCISIIRLNVLSFNSDEYDYLKSVIYEVDELEKEFTRLNSLAQSKMSILKNEFDIKLPLFEGINDIINRYKSTKSPDIEKCVSELQNLVWKNRNLIWKSVPNNPIEILNPELIFKKVLGFMVIDSGRYAVLQEDGSNTKVAGVIDQPNKLVAISHNQSSDIKLFTIAHELGHAILHDQKVLHRETPLNSKGNRKSRNPQEIQADNFASSFLMPKNLVIQAFNEIYSTKHFKLDENSAFKLGGRTNADIRKECKNLRGLTRLLAKNEFYDNSSHNSLVEIFGVSVEAMAIRLEELELVSF